MKILWRKYVPAKRGGEGGGDYLDLIVERIYDASSELSCRFAPESTNPTWG
jgi:hypothetical protein